MSERVNYNAKIEQEMEYLRSFFQEHNLNMEIRHCQGWHLPGAQLTNLDTHESSAITCDTNKNKYKSLKRFYNIIWEANIADPDIILKVFANFDD